MESSLHQDVALYCDSYLALKRPLAWKTSSYYIKLCALAFAMEGRRPDPPELIDAIHTIKKRTDLFSYLRSARPYIAAYFLAGGKALDNEFDKLAHCYDVMKNCGFKSSAYLPIAAHALYSTTTQGSEQAKAEIAQSIFKEMKRNHPFLTSSDDYASSVILASTDQPVDKLMDEIETTYRLLKSSGLHIGNGLQFLSQILIFDPSSPEEKALRCTFITEKLREYKNRISSMYYGTIGFLALTRNHWEKAVEETLEALAIIKEKKCYGWGEREFHLMIAAALVCSNYYKNNTETNTTLLRIGVGATVEAIIAAQAAACTVAAVAASSSSSS